ncbi:MAG: 30S ribosome-binding factor RbfA [Myxococcota bacterium]|jgi:ribosome-binding factor A|nr:30S ribosome-binding factor RbfA [Myxococcota bacterium]
MAHGNFRRADRVEVSIQRGVSQILTRGLPEDLPALITVTAVDMSSDLRHANVLLACYSQDESLVEETFRKLQGMQAFIRGELPKYVPMKYVPQLHFRRDDAAVYGTRVVGDLGRLVKEADAREQDHPDEPTDD